MNVQKQIDYWRSGSEEALEVAQELMDLKRWSFAMFLAHLSIEKMLKAHVTRQTKSVPPKTHILERLAHLGGINLDPQRLRFVKRMDIYQIQGRYPDAARARLDPRSAKRDMEKAKELLQWLKSQL